MLSVEFPSPLNTSDPIRFSKIISRLRIRIPTHEGDVTVILSPEETRELYEAIIADYQASE